MKRSANRNAKHSAQRRPGQRPQRRPGQRLRRTLIAVALVTAAIGGTAGWAVGSEETAVTGPPPGAAAWRADTSLGRALPDPATAPADEVAGFFAGLGPARREALVRRHPLTVGNLDGAPVELRYEANRRALKSTWEGAKARATEPGLTLQDHQRARAEADRYAELLAPGRQILAFDPRGRGQVAEVYGDLASARRTAVVVPGSDIDLATFDGGGENRYGKPAGMARSLRERMARQSPGTPTAVIAWVGYTTPVGIGPDAATSRLAEAGAPRLARFLRGLAATGAPAPTVLCHSYGSVVCGEAARDGDGSTGGKNRKGQQSPKGLTRQEAAGLVVFGSPGMHAGSVEALGTSVPVWAARDRGDWIGRVPNVEFLGLGHGSDPASPEFGARVVSAGSAEGHAGYLVPGTRSLTNFAAITLGAWGDVHCSSKECTHGV
ncbi:alpha/beta hydrolase [Streptomyces sp. NPDC054796]